MGLKPDHWIRKMAREHGMIEPFADSQVRNGVISYGVSSYGYDIRVADEFKIFTNVFSAIVDPKQFDPRSMVDYKGDVCVIPPNSFALARTIEYFRIPRSVLTICLGKSTYARCFRGDTRVALVDGTAPTLEQMARRAEDGELFWGYSIGQFGRIIVSLLEAPRLIGKDALIEITLDNQAVIHCTPDHEFVLRDGRMIQANELRPGDSLMPLYRKMARGYEMVYQPTNRHLYPTYRLADEWNLRNGIYPDQPDTHRHHKDRDRLNNLPWNIERMEMSAHIKLHNQESYGEEFDLDEHSQAIRGAFGRLSLDPEWRAHFSEVQQERALQFWNDERYALAREQLIQKESHNRRITGIRELPGDHDVYCLTVPEAGNFALEAGVFVSNCGIIVNVTPFEPQWTGYVTLEISNTTPLPAKIYANEGIAQVLFFEADEPCETSYADKKGKYQSQQSIVLPKL
jgi:deoxycytidine triphosphate deaminase